MKHHTAVTPPAETPFEGFLPLLNWLAIDRDSGHCFCNSGFGKFLNLQSDARISALQGLRVVCRELLIMVYPIAIQRNLEKLSSRTNHYQRDNIELVYGYPAADSANAWSLLIESTFADSIFNENDPAEWYFHNTSRNEPLDSLHDQRVRKSLLKIASYFITKLPPLPHRPLN